METSVISNKSDIYVGGGKWLTENKATYFPTFTRRRFLRSGETIGDFKEISDAEKTALEKLRDGWTRPPQIFIDQWNAACGAWGRYNEETGYFELNGLTDITYEEAVEIYRMGDIRTEDARGLYHGTYLRTNLPSMSGYGSARGYSNYGVIVNCSTFTTVTDVLNLCSVDGNDDQHFYFHSTSNKNAGGFLRCKRVIGVIDLSNIGDSHRTEWFSGKFVENVKVKAIFTRSDDPFFFKFVNIDAMSVRYLVENAEMKVPTASIIVDKRIFARLTDENDTEWYQILLDAAERGIQFITT